ncbi:MAG TPA: TraB/GumN family protein [Candidatus Thermoplasmatota archaeon]|nr:TraB/GumN family protein [Candidatus Thermoplasmatota archaeon]
MQVELPGITLVGTAHVSKASVDEVRETIARVKPAVVAVELDENRRKAIVDKKGFEETPITDLLKGGRGSFILAQTLLASYQRRMGAKEGVEPGAEMLAALHSAEEHAAQVALVDRDIGVTLRRAYGLMTFREKWRLTWELFKSVMGAEDEEEIRVSEMLQEDVLTTMMAELAAMAPTVANVLIHERDSYLAANILEASKKGHVVAVLGAGHLKGVEQHLRNPHAIPPKAPLEVIPKKRFPVGKFVGWALILSIVGFLAWGLYEGLTSGDFRKVLNIAGAYVLITGTCSALGALAARAHPFSIATAFVAAPFTILHPTLAAGWFSGLAEAKVRTPTVKDFHEVSKLQTLKEFWANRLMRVLMVAALTNIGAMVGAYGALAYFLGESNFMTNVIDWIRGLA